MNYKMRFKIIHKEYYLQRFPLKIRRHPSKHSELLKTFTNNITVRIESPAANEFPFFEHL